VWENRTVVEEEDRCRRGGGVGVVGARGNHCGRINSLGTLWEREEWRGIDDSSVADRHRCGIGGALWELDEVRCERV
jgi:hypothetical protein